MAAITRVFGAGFDEASFAIVNGLMRFQKTSAFLTDRNRLQQVQNLREQSAVELFAAPPRPTEIKSENFPLPWQVAPYGVGYKAEYISFPSAIKLDVPNNDTVYGYYIYRPGHETAPTLFYLHGWMAYSPAMWLRPPLSLAQPLGLNVFFLEQPFHMHRTPPGTSSGQLSVSGDLLMALNGVQQAVSDVRAGLQWLKDAQGVEKVALLGRSMGGLVAATTLTVEASFACAILDIPAVSPHSSIWRSNYTRSVRSELLKQGLSPEETMAAFEALRPGRFPPTLDSKRILLIEATADRACFPEDTERFAHEWNLPIVRVEFGHMSVILSRQARFASLEFLRHWLKDKSEV